MALLAATPSASALTRLAPDPLPPAPRIERELSPAHRPANGENICLFGEPDNGKCRRGLRVEGWNRPEAGASPACTAHFCVHWLARGKHAPNLNDVDGADAPFRSDSIPDNDSIPDYVEDVAAVAERSYAVEVGELGLSVGFPVFCLPFGLIRSVSQERLDEQVPVGRILRSPHTIRRSSSPRGRVAVLRGGLIGLHPVL